VSCWRSTAGHGERPPHDETPPPGARAARRLSGDGNSTSERRGSFRHDGIGSANDEVRAGNQPSGGNIVKALRKIGIAAVAGGIAVFAVASAALAQPAANKNIVLMVGVKGDPFYVSMQCGAQVAAKAAGYSLQVQGPDKFDATLQNPLLDAVAAAKPAALLVAPNDVKASAPPLKRIQKGGTKVVLVDTIVTDKSVGVSRIATDNELGGEKAAQALAQLGVKGKVLVISTDPGVSSVDARIAGFNKKAATLGMKLVSKAQYSHNQPATAAQIVSAALAKDPDLKGVFATNLFSAQGVATGIRQAGKSGKVKVVGFDAGPDQIKQLKAGQVQALVAQKPYDIGQQGVKQAVAALTGGKVTANIGTTSLVITKANLNQPAVKKYVYKASC
jgi:ribose transport system substrate-binding protein